MSDKSFSEQVKLDIVLLLLDKMEKMQISSERVVETARYVLSYLEGDASDEKVWEIIPKLDDGFPELAPVVAKYLKEKEDRFVSSSIENLKTQIKSNLESKQKINSQEKKFDKE